MKGYRISLIWRVRPGGRQITQAARGRGRNKIQTSQLPALPPVSVGINWTVFEHSYLMSTLPPPLLNVVLPYLPHSTTLPSKPRE